MINIGQYIETLINWMMIHVARKFVRHFFR